ncbi:cystathione beta-lyase [Pseudonocardia thermophila]|uniref:cysteine-S-conjugate beta-lyase n=1 Tax=Pseudonocardia thermophila TaxID=1848 RepID=A0A1M7B3Q4_PSETH|nr:aminotransferase class I/II-fold pyridoxal phosphate-dependent enzyme [Pseudonocardia thermophila]SHL49612.1 cystathione beta-lyase [Pseudonocardia thermophila]
MTDPWLPLAELRTRTTQKWRTYPPDVLPLFVAEMDTGLAEPVVRAVTEAVARGDCGYPIGTGYAEAFAVFAGRRWAWKPPVEATLLVPDVMAGLAEVLRAATGPGDPIVVNDPVYPPFFEMIRHLGRTVVEVPLTPEHRLDLAALEAAYARLRASGGRVAHLLCNPQNPTGTVHTRAELTALAELAAAHEVRVVADEIHAPLVTGEYVPYLTVPGTADAVALHSASKGWNLAGLKAALAVAGPAAVDELAALPSTVPDGASHIAVLAHTAAFAEATGWLDDLVAAVERNRALLAELIAEHLPGVVHRPAPATYLAWLDCRGTGLGDDPAAVFLERGRVALVPGPAFGTSGAGHARLNLATSPEILTEAVVRMARALRA